MSTSILQKADSLQVTEKTVIQLIAANVVRVEVDTNGEKPLLHCKLCFDKQGNALSNSTFKHPCCSLDKFWENIIEWHN